MKVLHLASWYPNSKDNFDGDFIERHLKALSLHMPVHVIHVVQKFHLLKNETRRIEYKNENSFTSEIHFVPLPNIPIAFLQKLLFTVQYNRELKKAIKHYIKQNGKPDLVHVHVPVKAGYGALWMKCKWNVPFVITEHSSAYFENMDEDYFTRSSYFKRITKNAFEESIMVSSVSQWLLNRLKDLFHIKETKVIRNVVDTQLFYPVISSNSRKRFIHVSMMMPLKNMDGIVKALQLLIKKRKDWEFVFVGPATDALIEAASVLKENVRFTGTLNHMEVAKEMREADTLVHFSRYENLPCVVNEALCCGLSVISSDVGGISELIHDGNGILVPDNDVEALDRAMVHYLEHSNKYDRLNISREAEIFNYSTTGLALKEIYEHALKATIP
jgi:glycosyltransferase involved in cell wall biosynthesis